VAFSPDGRLLVATGSGNQVRVWEVAAGEETARLPRYQGTWVGIAFSPDGRLLASGSNTGTIRLWDVASGRTARWKRWRSTEYPGGGADSLAFDPTGRLLAAGGEDGTIRLFRLDTGRPIARLRCHLYHVDEVAFSPDGRRLVSCAGGSVRIWATPA
jgi:WD40 repeat protein